MLKLVVSSVRHNLGRYLATLIAIMTGVGFYTAVGVISDGIISSLEGNVDAEYGNVDVAIVPDENAPAGDTAAEPEPLKVPQATVDQLLGAARGRRRRWHPDRIGRVPRRRRQTVRHLGSRSAVGHRRRPQPARRSPTGTPPTAPARSRSTAAWPRTMTSRSATT